MAIANGTRGLLTRAVAILSLAALAGCGGGFSRGGGSGSAGSIGSGGFSGGGAKKTAQKKATEPKRSTIWDLFKNQDDPNVTVKVNKYIWNASLDVLDFLPIEAADPFTGVIVTGYGRPPGGGKAYRATIYIKDPALDARSLHVALQTRSGPVSPETVRAIEDAILTRARQLRIADSKL